MHHQRMHNRRTFLCRLYTYVLIAVGVRSRILPVILKVLSPLILH